MLLKEGCYGTNIFSCLCIGCTITTDISFVNIGPDLFIVIARTAAGDDIPGGDSGGSAFSGTAAISGCRISVAAAVVTVGIVVSVARSAGVATTVAATVLFVIAVLREYIVVAYTVTLVTP